MKAKPDLIYDLDDRVSTVSAQASVAEIDQRLRVDYEFFAEFFMPDSLDIEIPEFHHQTWGNMIDPEKKRVIEAIPREHAKTTQAKLAVVYHFQFLPHRFCVYLSNTNTIALNACKDIFAFFNSPNYTAVYGPIVVETASEGNSLWIFRIRLRNGREKRCILRAAGANQQMRGINIDNQRPDIAVVDDVEDLENTESDRLQKKLDKWIFATFLKALAHKHKVIWIGNMLRKTSLLARLTTRPEFKETWHSLVLGAIIMNPTTGQLESLWPALWTLDKLIADFQQYAAIGQTESWYCEMMNMPGLGEAGFQVEDMRYEVVANPEDYLATFITVDPAFGLDPEVNDSTAIVVHGIPNTGPPQVLTYKTGHMSEVDIFNQCIEFMRYWKCFTWGIEHVAAQRVLLTLFEVLLLRKQESRVLVLPLQASTNQSKAMRIKTFVNLMKDGEYKLPHGEFEATTQFLQYDMRKKDQVDDLVDAISYGPQMLIRYKSQIIDNAYAALNLPTSAMAGAKQGLEIANV